MYKKPVPNQPFRMIQDRTTSGSIIYHHRRLAVHTLTPTCVFLFPRLKIFSEESVPLFGPPLPSPPVFTDHQEFRDFLLVKRKQSP